jgi:hypothetical protein
MHAIHPIGYVFMFFQSLNLGAISRLIFFVEDSCCVITQRMRNINNAEKSYGCITLYQAGKSHEQEKERNWSNAGGERRITKVFRGRN